MWKKLFDVNEFRSFTYILPLRNSATHGVEKELLKILSNDDNSDLKLIWETMLN